MTIALNHRFTVDDYYGMAEAGILKPGAKVETVRATASRSSGFIMMAAVLAERGG